MRVMCVLISSSQLDVSVYKRQIGRYLYFVLIMSLSVAMCVLGSKVYGKRWFYYIWCIRSLCIRLPDLRSGVHCLFIYLQWFGNLVTMAWWDGLWLNEGFASFMEYLGTNSYEPTFYMVRCGCRDWYYVHRMLY